MILSSRDVALWDLWRSVKDADAFAEIVSRHSGMVFSSCKRVLGNATDAEDVAQECFLELMRARTAIRSSLAAWLHTMAVHRSLDLLKNETRRRRRERGFVAKKTGETVNDDLLANVDRAIAALPQKLREPVILRFLEAHSHESAGQLLGVSESTVRYRVNKGIDQIRKILSRREVTVSTAVLTTTLASSLVEAAPLQLTATLGKMALAAASGTTGTVTPVSREITRETDSQVMSKNESTRRLAIRGERRMRIPIFAAAASIVLLTGVGAIFVFQSAPPDPVVRSLSIPTIRRRGRIWNTR